MVDKNIIIASDGKSTFIFSDEKVYGENIKKIIFEHEALKEASVNIELVTDAVNLKGDEDLSRFKKFLDILLSQKAISAPSAVNTQSRYP